METLQYPEGRRKKRRKETTTRRLLYCCRLPAYPVQFCLVPAALYLPAIYICLLALHGFLGSFFYLLLLGSLSCMLPASCLCPCHGFCVLASCLYLLVFGSTHYWFWVPLCLPALPLPSTTILLPLLLPILFCLSCYSYACPSSYYTSSVCHTTMRLPILGVL